MAEWQKIPHTKSDEVLKVRVPQLILRKAWTLTLSLCWANACTWTNISSSNKMLRNHKGLQITMCMHSWGKFWTKRYIYNNQKTQLLDCASPLHTIAPKGWANHRNHSSSSTSGRAKFHPMEGISSPLLGEWAKEFVFLFFLPHCCSRDPN